MAQQLAQNVQQTSFPIGKGYSGTDNERMHANAYGPVDPFARQRYTNYQYPEAIKNISYEYTEIVLGLITDDRYDVWFRDILPIREIDTLQVGWDVWQLETPDMDDVPYEGVVKFMSSGKRRESQTLGRLGKGIKMELGYFDTPIGRRHFDLQVVSIANGVKRWMAYDTVYALMNCNKYEAMLRTRFGQYPVSYLHMIDNEIESFAAVVKKYSKVDTVIEAGKSALKRNEVAADTLIVPQEFAPYIHLSHEERIAYRIAGPGGQVNFEQDQDILGSFRGLMCVQANFNSIYGEGRILEHPLVKRIQIGEYHEMFEKDVDNIWEDYTSRRRDLYTYNQDNDDVEKLHFKNSLMHTNIWDIQKSGWSEYVNKTLERYLLEGKEVPEFTKLYETNEDAEIANMRKKYGKKHLPLSVLTVDDNNKWMPMKLFGHALPWTIGLKHWTRMAESVLCKKGNPAKLNNFHMDFVEFLDVIDGIQKQPYNEAYWLELRTANIQRSLNSNGEFVGEKTPEFTSPITGITHPVITEWKPNMDGGMDLPQVNLAEPRFSGVVFPAGYASGIGLVTLEREKNKDQSPWKSIANRIAPAMSLFRDIVNLLREKFPQSLALQDETRMPWFHRPNALAIFIDNCLPLNADPLFLSSVRANTESGTNEGTGQQIDPEKMYYTPLPIGPKRLNGVDIPNQKELNKFNDYQLDPNGVGDYIEWVNPITQVTFFLKRDLITSPSVFPPYIQLYAHIGAGYANLYDQIIDSVSALAVPPMAERLKLLNDFANKLLKIQPTTSYDAGSIIKAVREKITNGQDAVTVIKQFLDIKGKGSAVLKQIKEFLDGNVPVDDPLPRRINFDDLVQTQELKVSPGTVEASITATRELIQQYNLLATLLVPGVQRLPPLNFSSPENLRRSIQRIGTLGLNWTANTVNWNNQALDNEALLGVMINTANNIVWTEPSAPERLRSVSDEAKYTSKFYRCPLVVSLALIDSMRFLPTPLIKPGNPLDGFVTPLEFHDTENGEVPTSVWKRSSYLTINNAMKSGAYSDDNIRYLQGAHPGTYNHDHDGESNSRFSYEDFFDSENPRKRGIGAFARGQEEDFDEDMSLSQFKKRKNDAAYYGYSGPSTKMIPEVRVGEYPIVTNVLKFNFKKVQEKPILIRMIIHALMMLPVDDWGVISKMIDDNLYVPFGVVNWRPFMTHEMLSMILMKRGIGTGANFFNKCNLMMQADAAVKTMIATFTFHAKSVVQVEKNVLPLEDIVPYKFLGGCNFEYILNHRDITEQPGRKSIICTLHPATETNLPRHASIEGFLPISEINPSIDETTQAHYWNWGFYDDIFGFSNRSRTSVSQMTFADVSDRWNTVCSAGFALFYNPESRQYDNLRPSKGHRGKHGNGRGCAAIWNGRQEQLPEFDIRSYNLT